MVNNPLMECHVQGIYGLARLPAGIGGLVGQKRHSGIYRCFLWCFAGLLEVGEGSLKVRNILAAQHGSPVLSLAVRRAVGAENFCLIIYLRQESPGCREIIGEVGPRHLRVEGTGINKISGKKKFLRSKSENR